MRTRTARKVSKSVLGGAMFASVLAYGQAASPNRMAPSPAQTAGGAGSQMGGMGQGSTAAGAQGAGTSQAAAMAQQPTGTGGAQVTPAKVYGDMLRLFEQQIVGAAKAMPEEKYSFAPTTGNFSGVRNFGQEVKHVIEANYTFFSDFGAGAPPDKAKIEAMTTKAELVQALQDSFTYAGKVIDSMTAENAFTAVTTGKRPQTRAGNAAFCLAHDMDHYGQMVEYLRMNGIVPPASQPHGAM